MNFIVIGMLIMQAARLACGTCVLESDFGFILNCNFKQSGLFRVRNLGGLKAHFGLGFSLGDELGFPESLGNLEESRRRSIGYKNGPPRNAVGVLPGNQQPSAQSLTNKRILSRSPMVLSPELRHSLEKQAIAGATAEMMARKNAAAQNVAQQNAMAEMMAHKNAAAPNVAQHDAMAEMRAQHNAMAQNVAEQNAMAEMRAQHNAIAEMRAQQKMMEMMAKKHALKEQAAAKQAKQAHLMTEARPLPLGVPAFKPIPKKQKAPIQMAERRSTVGIDTPNSKMSVNNKMVDLYTQQLNSNRTFHSHNPMISQPMAVPAFQAMPSSVTKITEVLKSPIVAASSNVNVAVSKHPNYLQFEEPKFDMKDISVEELASAANVTVDTIKHAIYVREQQLRAEQRAILASKLREEFMRTSTSSTTTTTTSSTTPRPNIIFAEDSNVAHENKVSKVMNAPKEYYPVGYDKNFDDNFKSKVDLPHTTFACSKQKHFPGLYADTDLGCMVFHVCALTDDGMIRKSFLCPENTLFDQTILKCNWWFYVDCSASKSVYDSNIPISKSYQLMKSITYFSKFTKNKESGETSDGGLDMQNLKDTMDEVQRNEETQHENVADSADDANSSAPQSQDEH